MTLNGPMLLAGLLVLALATAVALWTLAEEGIPFVSAPPFHRAPRVAGAKTEFIPGLMTVTLETSTSPSTFSVFLDEPVSVYQLLVLAEKRANIPLAWETDATGAPMLVQLGSLVASSSQKIMATVNDAPAAFDGETVSTNDSIRFALTAQ